MLAPMRFKSFTWPHNPRVYTIGYERQTAVHKVPKGVYIMEDLGRTCRTMRGEGEFVGPGAYDTFKQLASVFYLEGPGILFHPVWMTTMAFFTELELTQEPREDYVAYRFAFRENFKGYGGMKKVWKAPQTTASAAQNPAAAAQYHTVRSGETLWGISRLYGTTVAQIMTLNPNISNANLIYAGQRVRVR